MLIIIKEIVILIFCILLFLVLRSHYSKGKTIKDAFWDNCGYALMVLFSPVTCVILIVSAIYVVYRIMH